MRLKILFNIFTLLLILLISANILSMHCYGFITAMLSLEDRQAAGMAKRGPPQADGNDKKGRIGKKAGEGKSLSGCKVKPALSSCGGQAL